MWNNRLQKMATQHQKVCEQLLRAQAQMQSELFGEVPQGQQPYAAI